VTIDPGGENERVVDALADAEPVRAGEVIRIRTTGGGGWGDPLDRPYDEVLRDVAWGKVTLRGAWVDYGARLVDGGVTEPVIDVAASDAERARRRAQRSGDEPFFDRGPGYRALSGGQPYADVDIVQATER
jgi:N-methylhydantoinase B